MTINQLKQLARTASLVLLTVYFCDSKLVHAESAPDWVYMDLGEVIVTGNSTDGYSFVPGALQLLSDLRASGYKIALVSNIPETWGTTCDQKFQSLKTFLDSRMIGPQTLDWTLLDKVVLPPFDRYRKPKPFVFMTALANACPGKSIFMGEDDVEIAAASGLGFATYSTSAEMQLPTVDRITELLDTAYSFTNPDSCDFNALLAQHLEPQDVGQVSGCVVTPN